MGPGEFTRRLCRARVMSYNERSEVEDHPWVGVGGLAEMDLCALRRSGQRE